MKNRLLIIFLFSSFIILASLIAVSSLSHRGEGSTIQAKEAIPLEDKLNNDISEGMPDPLETRAKTIASGEEGNPPVPEEETLQNETKSPLPKYQDLLLTNPFIAGWLKVDSLPIDEAVMYTPKSQNYFLHRDIYGKPSEQGSLFIAVNWQDNFNNTLIYGHNMKDGSSFGNLKKYTDPSFGLNNKLLNFDTIYEEGIYELAAVFYSQIDEEELETEEDRATRDDEILTASIEKKKDSVAGNEDNIAASESSESPIEEESPAEEISIEELPLKDLDLFYDYGDEDIYRFEKDNDNGRFRYYYYTDLSDKDDFDYYVKEIKEKSLYDTGTDISWGDRLLTLSTCSYHIKNGRLVIVAKKIN
ncbi:MAG: class B sortase [Lachnospiraceae bacterium]|nr:class B sortase [Lachnospiraceae bacterium]